MLKWNNSKPIDRFWSRVNKTEGCWLWIGCIISKKCSYGRFRCNGKEWLAHRWIYKELFGPIPSWGQICHKCDNHKCVRPDHLFLGTASDNARDAANKGRLTQIPKALALAREARTNRGKSHCWKGHPFPEWLFEKKTDIGIAYRCRKCMRLTRQAWEKRQRG